MHNDNNKDKKKQQNRFLFLKNINNHSAFHQWVYSRSWNCVLMLWSTIFVKSIISRKFSYIVSRKKGTIMENLDRGTMNWRRWCLRSLFGGKIDNQTYYHCSSQYTCQKHEFFLKWLKKKKNHNNFKRYMQTVALVL